MELAFPNQNETVVQAHWAPCSLSAAKAAHESYSRFVGTGGLVHFGRGRLFLGTQNYKHKIKSRALEVMPSFCLSSRKIRE